MALKIMSAATCRINDTEATETSMIHEKLSHLSANEIDEMLDRYYEGREKVATLITEYRIDSSPSRFAQLLPAKVCHELECPYCEGQVLIQKRKSRDSYQPAPECPNCAHKYAEHCHCSNCRKEELMQQRYDEDRKREALWHRYAPQGWDGPNVDDLTFCDAVYLLSLYRHSVSDDLEFADPFSITQPQFAPTFELQNEIVKHLYARSFIGPSPDSKIEAFVFNDELTDTTAYYPTHVDWMFLPGVPLERKKSLIRDLNMVVLSPEDQPERWHSEVQSNVWRSIAKHEALEYFDHQMGLRGYELGKIGEKTDSVFEDLIDRFSVAQIYNLIWGSAKSVSDWIVREKPPQYVIRNSFISFLQRTAERRVANGWDVKPFGRDFNCPQTLLSSTFFNTFMGLGDEAFEMTPPN